LRVLMKHCNRLIASGSIKHSLNDSLQIDDCLFKQPRLVALQLWHFWPTRAIFRSVSWLAAPATQSARPCVRTVLRRASLDPRFLGIGRALRAKGAQLPSIAAPRDRIEPRRHCGRYSWCRRRLLLPFDLESSHSVEFSMSAKLFCDALAKKPSLQSLRVCTAAFSFLRSYRQNLLDFGPTRLRDCRCGQSPPILLPQRPQRQPILRRERAAHVALVHFGGSHPRESVSLRIDGSETRALTARWTSSMIPHKARTRISSFISVLPWERPSKAPCLLPRHHPPLAVTQPYPGLIPCLVHRCPTISQLIPPLLLPRLLPLPPRQLLQLVQLIPLRPQLLVLPYATQWFFVRHRKRSSLMWK
jgi:hypothetical protein